jgi:hypothetical protein
MPVVLDTDHLTLLQRHGPEAEHIVARLDQQESSRFPASSRTHGRRLDSARGRRVRKRDKRAEGFSGQANVRHENLGRNAGIHVRPSTAPQKS